MDNLLTTDVLIIGCGIAGGTAALELADSGHAVTVVTRAEVPAESNTHYAQGGIMWPAADRKNDSPALTARDIHEAGHGHCLPAAVDIVAETGNPIVSRILLERLKVPFDTRPDGSPALICEAAHSADRILHSADATGAAIEQALIHELENHSNVQLLKGFTAVDLLTPAHHARDRLAIYAPTSCVGAYLFDRSRKKVVRCIARRTILATGGLGQLFLRTTNPGGARGDGLAMAHRAGARVINTEFIQFHPTTFHHQHAPNFLISEAVRGAGARLVDSMGRPFMQRYDEKWGDLAPRDVVARGIHQEMLSRAVDNVYLDAASHIAPEKIRKEFPTIYQSCLEYGIDMTRDPIPVVPAAHYTCGGVWVDLEGRTTINDLYAVGEAACSGVHGANRLAGNSLLEGLVWGSRAAGAIGAEFADGRKTGEAGPVVRAGSGKVSAIADQIPDWQDSAQDIPDPALIHQDMSAIRHIMWNYVGLVRTDNRLERALSELRHLETEIEKFYRSARLTDQLIGLRNAVRSAVIVTTAAWENRTSLGCHYRC